MTTPEAAFETARRYVAGHRTECHVAGLLEDELDCFAVLELKSPDGLWSLGPGPVFVSKATGELWSDAYGNVLDKIDVMRPV